VAIACITDGAGLHLWSEIAARIAVKNFLDYLENILQNKIPPLQELKV
jgi:hypothetical protein